MAATFRSRVLITTACFGALGLIALLGYSYTVPDLHEFARRNGVPTTRGQGLGPPLRSGPGNMADLGWLQVGFTWHLLPKYPTEAELTSASSARTTTLEQIDQFARCTYFESSNSAYLVGLLDDLGYGGVAQAELFARRGDHDAAADLYLKLCKIGRIIAEESSYDRISDCRRFLESLCGSLVRIRPALTQKEAVKISTELNVPYRIDRRRLTRTAAVFAYSWVSHGVSSFALKTSRGLPALTGYLSHQSLRGVWSKATLKNIGELLRLSETCDEKQWQSEMLKRWKPNSATGPVDPLYMFLVLVNNGQVIQDLRTTLAEWLVTVDPNHLTGREACLENCFASTSLGYRIVVDSGGAELKFAGERKSRPASIP